MKQLHKYSFSSINALLLLEYMYLHKYTEYLDPRLLQDSRYAIHRRNCSSFSFAVLRENKYYHPKSQVKLRNDHKYRVCFRIIFEQQGK